MGQSTSLSSESAEARRPTVTAASSSASPALSPADVSSTCVEMEAMLRNPTLLDYHHPSCPPTDVTLPALDTAVDHAAAASSPSTCPAPATVAAATVSVFCLDVSKQSLLQLREVLETPVPQRAAAFHRVAKRSLGVQLTAPGSTSVDTLKRFLLAQTSKSRRGKTGGMSSPAALHVFALRDPTVTVENGEDGPVTVTREMTTDLLLPLHGSDELAAFGSDPSVLAFAPEEEEAASASEVDESGVGSKEVRQEGRASGERGADAAAPRTVVLLYTRDARFGFDGGDMLLIGCCVALCACICAGICCCVSAASKQKQQQQTSNSNDAKPNYNNNGVPDYYSNNNNNTNYNNNNSNQNYYNNNNNNNNGYYGQSQQPNGNYGNPYAPTGYDNNNNNNGAVNGYGTPPNAYQNNNNYQNQYQQQQQQQYQQQPQMNYGNGNNAGAQPQGPSPL